MTAFLAGESVVLEQCGPDGNKPESDQHRVARVDTVHHRMAKMSGTVGAFSNGAALAFGTCVLSFSRHEKSPKLDVKQSCYRYVPVAQKKWV